MRKLCLSLKSGGVVQIETLHLLLDLLNAVYKTGHIPKEGLLSTFCAIFKTAHAKDCSEFRTISLITPQTVFKSTHGLETNWKPERRGFNIMCLRERYMDMNVDVHSCYVDFKKAFDERRHEGLVQIRTTKHIDKRDWRILRNRQQNYSAQISVDKEPSSEIEIRRGVQRGCLAPTGR